MQDRPGQARPSVVNEDSLLWRANDVLPWMWHHPANRRHRLRKLIEATIFQARGRLLGKPTLARLGEYYLWADVGMSSSKRALYANPPDWAEMHAWERLLRPGDLFIDAGANIGIYTLWASQLGAQVIAVEP